MQQSHNHKKQQQQQYATASRFHPNKGYTSYFQAPPGDVAAYSGGPGGAAGASLRLNQYPASHPPPAAAPQPPQGGPPQLRAQAQPQPHNPHNATPGAPPGPPHSQQHHTTHTHATLSQHTQHHQVLQGGGVSGHGTPGVGSGVGQVGGVPPGPSPAPPGPPHEINTQNLPPGSTQQIQQGSGGSLPVSGHSIMYPSSTQNQPQGPQQPAQGQYYPHPGGPNAPPHIHSTGQQRQVIHSQHMPGYPVMPPNMVQFYQPTPPNNVLYQIAPNGIRHILNGVPAGRGRWLSNRMTHPIDIEFQAMGPPRQSTPHSQPGQFHPTPMPQTPPYQAIPFPPQSGKHETAPITPIHQFRQPQPVFYPPTSQQQPLKPPVNQAPLREKKLLAIVDPTTGKNILDDIKNDKADSNKSSESSASNTPAPSGTPPNKSEQVDIAAHFAAEVAKKAAEKDMEPETVECVVRTNKQSEPSSIIISDCRESKDHLKNSLVNKVEHVNSENVDNSAVGKSVPEPVDVLKPQLKPELVHVASFQSVPQAVPILTAPTMLPQMPPQVAMQQLAQPVQQIPQQIPQQPPMVASPQPPVHVAPLQAPQHTPLQAPPPPQPQLKQPPPPQQQQQPPQQQQQQHHHHQQQQQHHQQQQQQQQQQHQQQQHQQVAPPPLRQQQPSPNQLNQQPPQKQKSPSPPQQHIKVQQNAQVPIRQTPPPEIVAVLPKQQPHLPSPPPQLPPQQNITVNDNEQKVDHLSQMMASVQIGGVAKAEPLMPVKPSSPKPTVLPPPVAPKEEEVAPAPAPAPVPVPAPEPQPTQGKRRGAPREENTPARDNEENAAVQPVVPPQKAASPPAVQQTPPPPPTKLVAQPPVQNNAKEKEKTPELAAQQQPPQTPSPQPQPIPTPTPTPTPTPPPPAPQKSVSLPPSKEATPQPTMSPTPSDESKSERNSKEREVNNVEGAEMNNIHDGDDKDDKQLKYSYKDDQWSPVNPDGKRQYDRLFLLELQNNPLSLKKPEALPNLEVVRDGPGRHKSHELRVPGAHIGGGPDFTPDYVKPAVIGNKQSRPTVGGRNSQQRRPGEPGGGQVRGGRGGPGKVLVINIASAGRDSKLKTTENAWKPSVIDNDTLTDEQAGTEEVVKRMRGILNKLTPEKFKKLVETVKQMPIDTTERLSAVIDLIFEKAVDEQGFSSTYALLCQVLSKMSVREGTEDVKSEVKFRNLIINKCQKEFEKDNIDDIKAQRLQEIEDNPDPDKKIELKAKWDFDEGKLRQRSVGNIRFIGELYKLRMLTSPIMMRILTTLLEKKDEESLECLCKLLSTIGKILEQQCNQQPKPKEELEKQFRSMHRIIGDRQTNSRVRFLLMDVVDLRANDWVPRREDNKPKTKAQVHEEVKREEIEQQIALASTPNRRDDRDRGDRGDRNKRMSRDNTRLPMMSDNEGWNTVASTKSRTFDSSRLKNTFNRPGAAAASEPKEVILRGTGFSSWARGSSGGGLKDHEDVKTQENRFNVLGDSMGGQPMSGDNRRGAPMGRLAPGGGPPRHGGGFGSKSMPHPPNNDKESALSAVKKLVGNDRSKSTSRPQSRDNSVPRENDALKGPASLDAEAAEKFAIAIIEEYAHNADVDDAKSWIKERFSAATVKYFVQYSLEWVIDREGIKRRRVGRLFHDLLLENLISPENFLEGVREILSLTDDFFIDIPQVCEYLGEIFAPCLSDEAISLQRLLEMSNYANSKSATVFACILAKAATIMSPNKVADVWSSSGLDWSNIVPANVNVDEFLETQQVKFTLDRTSSTNNTGWEPQKLEAEFLKLFKNTASNTGIIDWVEANIGNDAKTSKFIRALVTALVESQCLTSSDGSSIVAGDDFEDKMKFRLDIVRRYVDTTDKLELQVIYALQALSVKHSHPKGLLEKCFNAFYDNEIVSEEAFDEWMKYSDPEEQEGKGVCVASVQTFMRWLKEAEIEESEAQG